MSHHPYCFLQVSPDVRHNPNGITVISWSLHTDVIISSSHLSTQTNLRIPIQIVVKLRVRRTDWCILRDAEQGHVPVCTAGSIIEKIWGVVQLSFFWRKTKAGSKRFENRYTSDNIDHKQFKKNHETFLILFFNEQMFCF